MQFPKKNLTIGIVVVVAALVVVGVLAGMDKIKLSKEPANQPVYEEVEKNLMDGTKAHELALVEAKKWQADAVLAYMNADQVGQVKGRSSSWTLIFTSSKVKGKGYQVMVKDFSVIETKEIPYVGSAAELPPDIISQEEAVAQVRAMSGFKDIKILGVDAVYGPGTKTWYWGVKTSKGTVSVKASR